MTPADLLREVKRRLLSGPAQTTWNRNGRYHCGEASCLLGHLGLAIRDGAVPFPLQMEERIYDALADDPAVAGGQSLSSWNDRQRSLWPLLALINRAIRRLEAAP